MAPASSSPDVWLFQEAVGSACLCCSKFCPLPDPKGADAQNRFLGEGHHQHTRGISLDFQLTGLYQLLCCDVPKLLQVMQKSMPKNFQQLTMVPILLGEKWWVGGYSYGQLPAGCPRSCGVDKPVPCGLCAWGNLPSWSPACSKINGNYKRLWFTEQCVWVWKIIQDLLLSE